MSGVNITPKGIWVYLRSRWWQGQGLSAGEAFERAVSEAALDAEVRPIVQHEDGRVATF